MAIEKVMVDSVGNTTKYHRLNEAKFIFDSNQLTMTISSYSDEEYRNLEKLEISDIESAIARSRELFSKTELTDDEKNELKSLNIQELEAKKYTERVARFLVVTFDIPKEIRDWLYGLIETHPDFVESTMA